MLLYLSELAVLCPQIWGLVGRLKLFWNKVARRHSREPRPGKFPVEP